MHIGYARRICTTESNQESDGSRKCGCNALILLGGQSGSHLEEVGTKYFVRTVTRSR